MAVGRDVPGMSLPLFAWDCKRVVPNPQKPIGSSRGSSHHTGQVEEYNARLTVVLEELQRAFGHFQAQPAQSP